MVGRPPTISTHTAHKPPWTGGVAKLAGVGHRWVWVSSISYMYARASLALGGTGDESELDRTGPNWTELGPVQKWTEVGYFRSTSSTTPSPVARADERSGPPFSLLLLRQQRRLLEEGEGRGSDVKPSTHPLGAA